MAAEDDSPIKKERDPILTIGFIVLVLAFATVGGIFINDNYLKSESTSPAVTGDTVSVNYTGSYYGFHAEAGSSVFDTSSWSIANDPAFPKSFEFTLRAEGQYAPLSFTLGGTDNYLRTFMAATHGLRPGDSAQVCIAPEDGYGALTADDIILMDLSTDLTIPRIETMSKAEFVNVYNGGRDITANTTVRGPYGWDIDVIFNPASPAEVTVVHDVIDGEIYRMNKGVNVEVALTASGDIEMTYLISSGIEFVPFSDNTTDGTDPTVFVHPETGDLYKNVKLVKIFYSFTDDDGNKLGQEYYITAIDDVNDIYVLKNTAERVGMYLYFDVTRV